MAHPQLLSQLLGHPLPPQPGESGAPGVPVVAPAMEPGTGQQAPQGLDRFSITTVSGPGAVERHVVRCAVHGPLSAHFRLVDATRARRCAWCEGRR